MNTSQQQELHKLKVQEYQSFVKDCNHLFRNNTIIEEHHSEVKTKTTTSYFYNGVSAVFAIFGIYVLSGDTTNHKAQILLVLLALIIIGNEWLKRYQIIIIAKRHFDKKPYRLAIIAIIFPTLLSVSITGYGGYKLGPELRGTPTLVHNTEIDSLKIQLHKTETSIEKQEGTTWKGRVTRTANGNLTNLYKTKDNLLANIKELELADKTENSTITAQFNNESDVLGWLLGFIGILMDVLLYTGLFRVMKCKHEIALLYKMEEDFNIDINGDGVIGNPKENTTPTPPQDPSITLAQLQQLLQTNNISTEKRTVVKGFGKENDFSSNILTADNQNKVATSSYLTELEIEYIKGAYRNANSNITSWNKKPDTNESKAKNIKKYQDVKAMARKALEAKGIDPDTVLVKRKKQA